MQSTQWLRAVVLTVFDSLELRSWKSFSRHSRLDDFKKDLRDLFYYILGESLLQKERKE